MVEYLTLKDYVHMHIKQQISENKLVDQQISEQRIADELNISKTPVREALIQLESDGLIERRPRRGFFLKTLSLEDIQQLYEIIGILDAKAAILAMQHLTEEDYEEMYKTKQLMDDAINREDYQAYNQLQIDFHHLYINKCQNKYIIEELERLKRFLLNEQYEDIPSESRKEVLLNTNAEHALIIKAFIEKNKNKLKYFIADVHWGKCSAKYEQIIVEE